MGYGIKKATDVQEKCLKLYGGKYSLIIPEETVEYDSKVLCECNVHKEKKYVNLRHFIGGDTCGCKKCEQEKKRAVERDNYIKKFVDKWGDKYSFDNFEYIDLRHQGTITCKQHGDFTLNEIRYAFYRIPCPVCLEISDRKNRNEGFLARLKEKYGEQYVWLTTDFGDYFKDYVEFVCPVHGKVKQTLCTLLNADDTENIACGKCKKERQNKKQSYSLEDAVSKAQKLENCKYYDFDSVTEWRGVKEYYTFKCKKHGDIFQQTFDSLFSGHNSCPGCIKEMQDKVHSDQSLTTEEFIEKAKSVYGDVFDYSLVDYINTKTRVTVICPKHGPFSIVPGTFLCKSGGCPKCRESSLETEVRVFLETNGIEYISEKSVRDLTGKMRGTQPQRVDFFLPKYNVCIECHGAQHFAPTKMHASMSDETANASFEKCVSNDKFKYDSLNSLGFDVLYFTKSWLREEDVTGWYEDKKCFYNTDSLLKYFNSGNHADIRTEWYDKNKYILVPFKKIVKTVWNEHTCREEAKKYKTRTEFARGSQTAYGYACRNKWIDAYDWFTEMHHKWTYEECYNEAKKYNFNKDFDNGSPNACAIARKHGWIKDYVWLKKVRNHKHS